MEPRQVWRVGANWGGKSILDTFFDYQVAFFGTDSGRLGHYNEAAPGDLLAVSNAGEFTIVAIGEVLTSFMPLGELGVLFSQETLAEFGQAVGCRARFHILEKNERHDCSDYKRFYSMGRDQRINALYLKYSSREAEGAFDIRPYKKTLFDSLPDKGLLTSCVRYRIPIFQRPYSWNDEQISKLIDDLFAGFARNEKKFIGTMQLSEPLPLDADGRSQAYDVIDGQQRITTLLLMIHILQSKWGLFGSVSLMGILRTLVNRGEAQRELDLFWRTPLESLSESDSANAYCRNAGIILSMLNERMMPDAEKPVDPNAFELYLREGILIVVIVTNAGLSKTLEIFDIINTTGLDLNGADVFKIRFYEFLKDLRAEQEEVFERISELYKEIAERNRTGCHESSMPEILSILQAVLIGRYGLQRELYDYAADRFFNELFDSLLGIKQWQHFDKDAMKIIIEDKQGPLSTEGIQNLISHRYAYADDCMTVKDCTPALFSAFSHKMILESRYSRYWFYPIIFRSILGDCREYRDELMRLALVYSVIFARTVSETRTCIQGSCHKMFENGATRESVLRSLKEKRMNIRPEFEQAIRNYEIAGNRKWKLIACRLSEFLEYPPSEQEKANRFAYELIFDRPMDIEHIQSFHDKDGTRREQIWLEWGPLLNGIGNLSVLEENINRSIGNEEFSEKVNPQRKLSYCASKYLNIGKLSKMASWTREECIKRRDYEVAKLVGFLFE